jgi:hypothetical protein
VSAICAEVRFHHSRRSAKAVSGSCGIGIAPGQIPPPARSRFGYARGHCPEDAALQGGLSRYSQQIRGWPRRAKIVIKLESRVLNLEVVVPGNQ